MLAELGHALVRVWNAIPQGFMDNFGDFYTLTMPGLHDHRKRAIDCSRTVPPDIEFQLDYIFVSYKWIEKWHHHYKLKTMPSQAMGFRELSETILVSLNLG